VSLDAGFCQEVQENYARVVPDGFGLRVDERELFVPFKELPWFADASVGQIMAVERPGPDHLRWSDLDVDLAIESIEHPERFPLVSRTLTDSTVRRARPRRSPASAKK
jgi:hypothetical protein